MCYTNLVIILANAAALLHCPGKIILARKGAIQVDKDDDQCHGGKFKVILLSTSQLTLQMASNKGKHCPGSRGSYKQASIVSMSVLRENRGSLLAMLEAFLYDPLLSWTVSIFPSPSFTSKAVD